MAALDFFAFPGPYFALARALHDARRFLACFVRALFALQALSAWASFCARVKAFD
jgi:hypothetical protein